MSLKKLIQRKQKPDRYLDFEERYRKQHLNWVRIRAGRIQTGSKERYRIVTNVKFKPVLTE
jgi:hypothetical protein